MRIVEITKTFTENNVEHKGGHSYVMAEDSESKLRTLHGDMMGMSHPLEPQYRKYTGQDLTGKKIMCWRTGGIGDMYFLSPVLRHLKTKYKNSFLRFASGCRGPLEHLPEIDELYSMPFDAELLKDMDYHLMFQGIIESSNEKSKNTHAADMFYSYFKIDSTHLPAEDKKPRLVFIEEEKNWLSQTTKNLGIKDTDYVVGVQIETSAPLRNFPRDKMKSILDTLANEPNIKILLIGSPPQQTVANFYKGKHKNVIPVTNFSVRQSIILANRYNLVISSDSFMVQTAGALDKPLIGLYGPFPSAVRMKYYKNAIGLEPKVICSPCFIHDFRSCIKGFPSPCFTQIKIEDVLQAANYFKKKFTGQNFNFMAGYLKKPQLDEIEKYFLGADKGLCFFPGYFTHPNMIRVDTNQFVKPDISDLSKEFKRNSYPFVLFMENFSQQSKSVYEGSQGMVRPGGFFVVHKKTASEQFFAEIKKDVGKNFVLLYSKFNPVDGSMSIVGKRRY